MENFGIKLSNYLTNINPRTMFRCLKCGNTGEMVLNENNEHIVTTYHKPECEYTNKNNEKYKRYLTTEEELKIIKKFMEDRN